MKLTYLNLVGCEQIHDLSPLEGMPLKEITFNPRFIQEGMDVLRGMKTLETINVDDRRKFRTEEFWRLYAKGEFRK